MVLMLHANFVSIGKITSADFANDSLNAWSRLIFENIAISAVNVFIMISGWFGIKRTWKGGISFLWQNYYFIIGIAVVLFLLRLSPLRIDLIPSGIFNYWFVFNYFILYLFAPVINAYIESASNKQLNGTVALLFFLEIIGWRMNLSFIKDGYTAGSFFILYIIAAWMRRHKQYSKYGLLIYLGAVIVNIIVYKLQVVQGPLWYSNPFVVIQAMGLVWWFAGMKIGTSKFINWIAKSAFAVYILHFNLGLFIPYFKTWAKGIYSEYDGIVCILMLGLYCVAWFTAAILLDQPRKWLWNLIVHYWPKKTS